MRERPRPVVELDGPVGTEADRGGLPSPGEGRDRDRYVEELVRLDEQSVDLKLEAAAFLCLARQGRRVDPRFILHVVSIQRADGGWGQLDTPNPDNPDESSWHSTTLALLLLLHLDFPGAPKTPAS